MKKLIQLLCLCSLSVANLFADEASLNLQKQLAPKLAQLIDQATEVEIISLEPTIKLDRAGKIIGPPEGNIEGRLILGKATIKDREELAILSSSLRTGMEKSDGKMAICFDPLHALRIQRPEGPMLIVVSFQCGQGYITGFPGLQAFSINKSAGKKWSAVFEKHNLPRAK